MTSVSQFVTTAVVLDVLDVDGWKERRSSCEEHTPGIDRTRVIILAKFDLFLLLVDF